MPMARGASAFGATANATGVLATAVGRNSKALAQSASAFGDSASASAWGATAVGVGASAKANNSIAVGSQAVTEGQESTALGRRSYAGAQSATALGTGANASAIVSTAVGNGAKASAVQAAALGNEAKATGSSSTAIGVRSNSAGSSAIAVGTNSAASANNAVSIGTGSKATGSESTAIGYASKAEGVNSMAMGRESSATHENSVALGSYSVSKAEKSVKEATVGATTYNGFAGTAPKGTVSVGTTGRERQIVNVAAGEISATSTDAINGSQLYAVATKIGQSAKAPVVEAGKLITVETSTNANGQTVYTVSGTDFQPAIDANKANIAKNADAISTNTADIRSAEKLIDMNAKDIAANTNYIKAVEQKLPVVTAGKNTTVDISTDANGKVTYTVSSTDFQPAIDKNAKGIADNTKAISTNTAKIADVEQEAKRHTVIEAGHNMEVTSSKDENGATVYKVATSKDIGVNSLTVYNGPKITKDGIDARNTKIKNVTAGVDDNDAVNVSQLNQVKARQDAQSRALKQVRRTVINHGARLANVENRVSGLENKVDRLDHDVKKNRKRADAGISAVAAMANIPQVYLPGKSGVGVGVGYKHGQSAVAVGYSRSSDNGHHIIKLSAGVDTQKDVTVGAGYMYQW